MDPILILLEIAFFVILYEMYSGEIISNRRERTHPINRKISPAKFWLNIGIQLVIWVVLVLYQLGMFTVG